MIYPGLVSITFRQLEPAEIVALAAEAGLRAIEWGGDIHVPHGDLRQAALVRRLTEAAGLAISAYGSYYRVGVSEAEGLAFATVLATAVALAAPTIRVWAGQKGSAEADPAYRANIVAESRRIAAVSAAENISISFEYHGNTLTDTNESAADLLAAAHHPNLFTFWQPPIDADQATRLAGLRLILPKLTNIHVFYWPTGQTRLPLAGGAANWLPFLRLINSLPGDRYASLEFVRNDDPAQFRQDARTLRAWLDQLA
jgi:sugar phosphate isomerase/epimerase